MGRSTLILLGHIFRGRSLDLTGKFVPIDASSWLPIRESQVAKFSSQVGFVYLAILNSDIFSQLLAASSTHLSGGQWSLTKQYVDNIALPDLFAPNSNELVINELAQIGKLMFEGLPLKNQDMRRHTKFVKRAYGISENL